MKLYVGSSRSSALLYLGHDAGRRKIIGGFRSTCFSRIVVDARFTRTGRPAPTRCAARRLCFSSRVLGHCRTIFNRLALRLRLALTGRVIVINDFGGGALNDRLWSTAIDWLMYHAFLPIMAILAFRTILAILTLGPVLAVLPLRAILALGEFLAFRNLLTITIVAVAVAAVAIIHAIVVITVLIVLILILIIALILDGCLSLGCKYYSIIVLGVLEIVFSHHSVAGALCISCKSSVFFGDVLSVPPDFDIGTVALVVTG
jgi:hypothetical protein